jgi:Bifunctional DNA primase/polymerase, N-terminal
MEGHLMQVDFVAGALRLAEGLGWKVFPLVYGGKVPAIKGGRGCKDASSDPAVIRSWGRRYPHANVGIACGEPSGIIVIDVDPRHGGVATLAALAAKGRVLPPTPRARTGNEGLHYWFRWDNPSITNGQDRLGAGIDVKTTDGYVVGAGSWTGPSDAGPGGLYRWEVSPFEVPVARLPIWVTAKLCPPPRPKQAYVPDVNGGDIEPLAKFVASSSKGERNNRLHWAACRAGEMAARHQVSAQSAGNRLVAAAAAAGYFGSEVARTIDSGFQDSGLRYEGRS